MRIPIDKYNSPSCKAKHEIPDKYDSEDGVETGERGRKMYHAFSETQDE
jgi:hypothetical protein